jgi:hypothetical protein
MLLPAPSKLKSHLHAIYQKDTWGSAPGISQDHLNRTYQFHMDMERAPTIDPVRMLYVAGCRRVTVCGLTIVAPGEFEYELTTEGDGRVPHAFGLLPDVPTYYVDEVHGILPATTQCCRPSTRCSRPGRPKYSRHRCCGGSIAGGPRCASSAAPPTSDCWRN